MIDKLENLFVDNCVMGYRPFCIKGKKVSDFLIQSDKVTYPMENTEYLKTFPKWTESYIQMQKLQNGQYKLLKFLFV